MFYEVNFDEETRIMFEGQASGAIAKGGQRNSFIPDDALDNCIDVMKKVAMRLATDVAPVIDGTVCSMEVEFGVRADGNGTVMIAQDPRLGQFRVVIKRPIIKRSS
ncbi:MAG: hypothetical protein AB8H79_25810 [Myxococcota bacterium]